MVEKTTKKAKAAEQKAFHLYSVEKQGNKKNRAAAYLVDFFVAVSGRKHRMAGIGVSDSGQSGIVRRYAGSHCPADAPGRSGQGKSPFFKDRGMVWPVGGYGPDV